MSAPLPEKKNPKPDDPTAPPLTRTLFFLLFLFARFALRSLPAVAESQGVVTGIDVAPAGAKKGLVMGEPFVQPKHTGLSWFLLLLSGGYFGYALTHLFQKDRSKQQRRKNRERERRLVTAERVEEKNHKESEASSSTRQPKRKWSIKKAFSKSKDGDESRGDDSSRYSRM